jgi:hypothetical protein
MIPSDYVQALNCGIEAWSGFWGDPWLSGSLIMITYGIAAWLARLVALGLTGTERVAWTLAAVLLAFQVLNTPLDLHGLMWASGRCLAHIQGWYADRYAYQREILAVLAVGFCLIACLAMIVLRRHPLSNGLLVTGLCLSLGMTLVKGVNYHHLEALYQARVGPLRIPDLVELAGIACVLLAAGWRNQRAEAA